MEYVNPQVVNKVTLQVAKWEITLDRSLMASRGTGFGDKTHGHALESPTWGLKLQITWAGGSSSLMEILWNSQSRKQPETNFTKMTGAQVSVQQILYIVFNQCTCVREPVTCRGNNTSPERSVTEQGHHQTSHNPNVVAQFVHGIYERTWTPHFCWLLAFCLKKKEPHTFMCHSLFQVLNSFLTVWRRVWIVYVDDNVYTYTYI